MGQYTPEEIAKAVAALDAEAQRKAKAEERKAKLAADASLMTEVGIDADVVATLVDRNEVIISESGTSTWTGFTLGSVPFDDLGVSVKITVTVTNPDMFPEIKPALAIRKIEAEKAKVEARKAKKLEEARALLASEALKQTA